MIIDKGIGIDLGTTNSAVATVDLSDSDVIMAQDERDHMTTPSAVGIDPKTKAIIIGRGALQRRGTTPEPILSIKRKIGSSEIVRLGNEKLTPVQISALILKELKRQIQQQLAGMHQDFEFAACRAIITIPAYFGFQQIEDTRKAGSEAGLDVIELLAEPTAAATYYSWKHGLKDATFMVYDLGGGTFDTSIIRSVAGEYEVLGVAGNNYLGGDNFDRKLADHFYKNLIKKGYDLQFDIRNNIEDRLNFEKLVMKAEICKIELSQSDVTQLQAFDLFTDAKGNSVSINTEISRGLFEKLIGEYIDETIEHCRKAISMAKEKRDLELGQIDYILMVGGSSKIPYVRQRIEETFCSGHKGESKVRCDYALLDEPDKCVAFGSALRASTYGTSIRDKDHQIQIFFPTASTTKKTNYTLTGSVKTINNSIDLKDLTIALENCISGETYEEELTEKGQFAIGDITLNKNFSNSFYLRILDAEGNVLIQFIWNLKQWDDYMAIGGDLSRPAVLSRPIKLDIVRESRLYKKVVLKRGADLPAKEMFRFSTVDESREIRFAIYDEHILLKEISHTLARAPEIGTPIDFVIACDEKYFLTIHGEIEGQKFAANIEPPPRQKEPTVSDWETLQIEFDDAIHALPEGKQLEFRALKMRLDRTLKEGFNMNDMPLVQNKISEYRDLIEDIRYQAMEILEPPIEDFMSLADTCYKMAGLADQKLPNFNHEEWQKNIKIQVDKGQEAFANRNQKSYKTCYDRLVDYYFYIKEQIKPIDEGGQPQDPVSQAMDRLSQLREELTSLLHTAKSKMRNDLAERLNQLSKKLDELDQKVATEPDEVIINTRIIAAELSKISKLLKMPEETRGLPGEQ